MQNIVQKCLIQNFLTEVLFTKRAKESETNGGVFFALERERERHSKMKRALNTLFNMHMALHMAYTFTSFTNQPNSSTRRYEYFTKK